MTDLAARGAIQALQRETQTLKNRLSAVERRLAEVEARTGEISEVSGLPQCVEERFQQLEASIAAVARAHTEFRLMQSSAQPSEPIPEGAPVQEEWPHKHGKHGPFYQLSDGRKVRGKEAAKAAQAEIDNQNASAEAAG